MSDWIHGLPIPLLAIVIFSATWLATAAIERVVFALARRDRGRDFKAVSPGLLPPLGIIFGLLVAFLASQAWGDVDHARAAVNREASALRTAVLLSQALPPEAGDRLRGLIRSHIEEAQAREWPAMAKGRATLAAIAMVHSDNRRTARIAMGLFSTAVAVSILLIVAHDRPFAGRNAVGPEPLLQVQP